MKKLESLSTYTIDGKLCFSVKNPSTCGDFSHIIGENVKIDDNPYVVNAVERFTHLPPFHKGEIIGLMVDK